MRCDSGELTSLKFFIFFVYTKNEIELNETQFEHFVSILQSYSIAPEITGSNPSPT